jgi:DNA-binding transcriptional MocR family regulator
MRATSANSTRMVGPLGVHHLVRLMGDWSDDGEALHTRLADRLRSMVISGKLAAGVRLPSERSLAIALDVSRNTVGAAFDELRGEGVLTSRRGDGTYVSAARRYLTVRGDDRLESFMAGAARTKACVDMRSAALPGLPMIAEVLTETLADDIAPLLASHGYLPKGLPELRAHVASYYCRLGLPSTPDQILITSGAQQAMRMVAVTLLEPGSIVLVEEPSFRGAIEILRSVGARLVPLPRDPCGLSPAALTRAVQKYRPSLLMIQSTVHNPTGTVTDAARRRGLAMAAAEAGLPVLDDATLADAAIDGTPPTPMAAWGRTVLTVGSASKSFWGGLRVGWLRTDRDTVAALASTKAAEDLGTSVLAQAVAARLLPRVEEAHQQRREALRDARDRTLAGIRELLPEWQPVVPSGGASMWVKLPMPVATAVAQRAERMGVLILPGPTFSSVDALDDHLRIGFAGDPQDVRHGLEIIKIAWDHVLERRREPPVHAVANSAETPIASKLALLSPTAETQDGTRGGSVVRRAERDPARAAGASGAGRRACQSRSAP